MCVEISVNGREETIMVNFSEISGPIREAILQDVAKGGNQEEFDFLVKCFSEQKSDPTQDKDFATRDVADDTTLDVLKYLCKFGNRDKKRE